MRWRKSGLSGRELAEQECIASSTLYHWSRRLDLGGPRGRQRRSSVETRQRLLPLVVTQYERPASVELPPSPTVGMLEVVLPGGEIVRVPPGFDDTALVRVVRALGGGR